MPRLTRFLAADAPAYLPAGAGAADGGDNGDAAAVFVPPAAHDAAARRRARREASGVGKAATAQPTSASTPDAAVDGSAQREMSDWVNTADSWRSEYDATAPRYRPARAPMPRADFEAELAEFKKVHESVLASMGRDTPVQYRWDDGIMRDEPAPPLPYVVAKKKAMHPLVTFCRTQHGHGTFNDKGYCLRYDMGVTYEEHAEYLRALGPHVRPQYDKDGNWFGFDPTKTDRMKDDETYVFRGVRVTDPNHPLADHKLLYHAEQRLAEWLNEFLSDDSDGVDIGLEERRTDEAEARVAGPEDDAQRLRTPVIGVHAGPSNRGKDQPLGDDERAIKLNVSLDGPFGFSRAHPEYYVDRKLLHVDAKMAAKQWYGAVHDDVPRGAPPPEAGKPWRLDDVFAYEKWWADAKATPFPDPMWTKFERLRIARQANAAKEGMVMHPPMGEHFGSALRGEKR